MALRATYPDKIIAGLHQSYTLLSEDGPPSGRILVDGKDVPFRLIPLGPPKSAAESTTTTMKYKVTFLLPDDSAGKTLSVQFAAGSSRIEESKPIVQS